MSGFKNAGLHLARVLCAGVILAAAGRALGAAKKETWAEGYPSASAACRALIGKSDYVNFSRADVQEDRAHCWTKPKDGKGEEQYCCMVSKDRTTQPLKTDKEDDAKTSTPGGPADACADLEAMDEQKLKKEVLKRFNQVVGKVNDEFANAPAIAMEVISEAEVQGAGYIFGTVKINKDTMILSDAALNVLYGHILERLTDLRLKKYDPCLPAYLTYVPNVDQMNTPGGSPDFNGEGKASGLQLDITTLGESLKKKAQGKDYDFIRYTRKLKMDANGHAVKI